jgi:putative phage-type endonuclease
MTLHEFPDLEQGTNEWLDVRRGVLTASVVGKLLTDTLRVARNDYSRGLTMTLAAERITGWTEPSYMNDDMMRGVLHESIARDNYAEHNGVKVDEVGFLIRDDWGYKIGASPDGLIGDAGGLEIKCPRAKAHIRTIVADEVPAHYMAQVQACLLVSGREWWDYVSFCAGLPLWTKRVHPDPSWQTAIVEAAAAFEEAVEQLTTDYFARIEGLPMTERVDLDVVI